MRLCGVSGCGKAHHSRGYCGSHAYRFRTYGDPLQIRRPTPIASFWARLSPGQPAECWEWQGKCQPEGYGRVSSRLSPVPSGTRLAHRVAYELLVGPVAEGLHLDHLCRNPPCCNPDI